MRIVISSKLKVRLITAIITIAVAITVAAVFAAKGEQSVPSSDNIPISKLDTESDFYTVIALIDEKTDERALDFLTSVCDGFGIKATFFISSSDIGKYSERLSEILKNGNSVAMILTDTASMNKPPFMRYLAEENDAFLTKLGIYPNYVYIPDTPSAYAFEVIYAYGQYYIKESFSALSDGKIKSGDIVLADITSEKSVYIFAEKITKAISEGLEEVNMIDVIRRR